MEPPRTSLSGVRICYAITKNSWGGAQAYVHTLTAAAIAKGADVSVLIGAADQAHTPTTLSSRLTEQSIRVHPLFHMQRDVGILKEWRAFRELLRILQTERPTILHLNSSKMGILGACAGRIAGVPHIIFTAHGWPHREPRTLLWKGIVWCVSWITVFLSHTVIVVSACDRRTAPAQLLKHKLVRIYNGVPAFTYKTREEARAYLVQKNPELAQYETWLLMNAELHRNKGIDMAIRAVNALARDASVALVVQGAGEEREHLETLARSLDVHERVFLMGFVPDARTNLAAADIYIMPSRKEGLPLALLEAAYVGVPIIASAVGGMPEIIEHGETGLLVPPDDAAALTRAISQCLTNPDYAQTLGTHSHVFVTKTFTEDAMISETFALYT